MTPVIEKVRQRIRHPYYNYAKLWSFNAVFNFVCGGRGLGKTYGAKKGAIKANIRTGEQFIYLRRFKTELAPARATFFADIEHEFPDWDFRVYGNTAQRAPVSTREDKKRDWVVMGYFVTLSTAQTQKSVSFPAVSLIIFDEFIIESALPYLKNESTVFLNFYNTVDRNQDKTRVLFLANAVSMMNPYFIEYDIEPDQMPEWATLRRDIETGLPFICVHFPDSKDFQASVYNTRFGRFIKDTEYADYAVGNQFSDAHGGLVEAKGERAEYWFTLETKLGTFSIWRDRYAHKYFAQQKRPRGNEILFTMLAERMNENKKLLVFGDKVLGHLRTAYRQADMYFDSPATRNAFAEVFKRQ